MKYVWFQIDLAGYIIKSILYFFGISLWNYNFKQKVGKRNLVWHRKSVWFAYTFSSWLVLLHKSWIVQFYSSFQAQENYRGLAGPGILFHFPPDCNPAWFSPLLLLHH